MHGALPPCSSVSWWMCVRVCELYNNLYWHNSCSWRLELKITEVGNIASSKLSLGFSVSLTHIPSFSLPVKICVCVRGQPNKSLYKPHDHFSLWQRSSYSYKHRSSLQRPCMPRTHTNTSVHMNALESVNACRLKVSISCLISKAQQSIFFLWHLWKLETAQPIPVQFFWGSHWKRPATQPDSASSCFPRTNCSTLSALLTAEQVIGCQLLPHHAAAQPCSALGQRKGQEKLPPTRPT